MTKLRFPNWPGAWRTAAVALVVITSSVALARATEFIPSIGVSKSTDEQAADAQAYGGLALRIPLTPFLKLEGGIAYRQDDIAFSDIKVHQWPITASLWLAPGPYVYAGGGLGWYRTTYDYPSALPISDQTTDKLGVHLGGGLLFPLSAKLSLDLNGRYVFVQANDTDPQLPTTFDPDLWTASLGLAISF